jgi:hypothetical protein
LATFIAKGIINFIKPDQFIDLGLTGKAGICIVTTPISKNNIPIRLPDERWAHILEEHGELEEMRTQILDTVAQPIRILAGQAGEQLAIQEVEPGKYLVVVYREFADDGFIITAFLTRRMRSLNRREQLWP